MAIAAEYPAPLPGETGETEPVAAEPGAVEEAPEDQPGSVPRSGFLVIAVRVAVGVLCLVGLMVLGFVQAFGGPGLLIAGGSLAAGAAGWWWVKGNRSGKTRAGRASGRRRNATARPGSTPRIGQKRASRSASGGLGKRLGGVLPRRARSGAQGASGSTRRSASGKGQRRSRIGALGKRVAALGKRPARGAATAPGGGVGKRSRGGLLRRRAGAFAAGRRGLFWRGGKATGGVSGSGGKRAPHGFGKRFGRSGNVGSSSSAKRSTAHRGGLRGLVAWPFAATASRWHARTERRAAAREANGGKLPRGPVRAAWRASRTGRPRRVWKSARKSAAVRHGATGKTIMVPLSMLAGLGAIAGRWAWRTGKRRAAAGWAWAWRTGKRRGAMWWARNSSRVRDGLRKLGGKARANTVPSEGSAAGAGTLPEAEQQYFVANSPKEIPNDAVKLQ